jgi:hypothetical protein
MSKSDHARCKKLRMIDRCVVCNPGYGDRNQSNWIWQHQKRTGASLREAEHAYVRAHGLKNS